MFSALSVGDELQVGQSAIVGRLGADGSVRMFDIRHVSAAAARIRSFANAAEKQDAPTQHFSPQRLQMEYSMIVFEEPNRSALLRLAFNQQDANYLATFAQNSGASLAFCVF